MNRKAEFFSRLRKSRVLFRNNRLSAGQVKNINSIVAAHALVGDGEVTTLAYALATVYGEVGSRMNPVREGFAKTNAGAIRAVQRLAKKRGPNSAVARYVRPAGPYGHVYYGRGYPQLTWHSNYKNSSEDAGVDLEKYPDKMLEPVISARVLIRGIQDGRWNGQKKGIQYYVKRNDKKGMRRTVNVTDKWRTFAKYYDAFLHALKVLTSEDLKSFVDDVPELKKTVTKPVTIDETEVEKGDPTPPGKSVFGMLFLFLKKLFGGK